MPVPVPLVLLHAFPLDGGMWSRQREAFEHERPVHAPDLPGFGARPPVDGGLDAFAGAVLADLDDAGIDRAVIGGLSMGGYVAFRLYERAPERVAGLLLADTRAGPDDEAARARRTEQAERADREGIGWLPEAMLPALLGETTRRERPQVVAQVRSAIVRATSEGVASALLAMRERPDSGPLLPRITVPVLAVAGDEDELTPFSEAERIAREVPGGEARVLEGAGHVSNLEAPNAFDDAVRRLLERVDADRAS